MTEQPTYQQAAFRLTPPETRAPDTGAATPVEQFTPRDAAKALIRPYVLRGDPIDSLKGSMMGQSGADFHAQIGGSIAADGERKRVKPTQIGVSRIGAEPVSAIFSLSALYKEIQAEADANPVGTKEVGITDPTVPVDARPVEPIGRDPDVLPNRRLPDDFWPEFHLEWQFREANDMAPVSPAEFADMRDWSDGVSWPAPDTEIGGASGPSREDDVLADNPRDDRFNRDGKPVFDRRKENLDATINVLAQKVEQIVTGDGYRAYLRMLSRFHPYSANNVALIHAQYPDATKVMGYGNKAGTTGWKSMGRSVRQGETGIRIIRPVHQMIEDEATGEPKKVLTGFTTATVFDVSQTEGIPLPEGPKPQDLAQTEAERSLELDVALRRLLDEAGVRVVADHNSTQRGYWKPEKREIGIRADLTGVSALKTLAHETAHMLADHRREGVEMADAETVAESVAFVLLDHYGIDTSAYSVPYIATWARSPAVVSRNLDTVRTLSHVLLTAFGDQCPPDEDGGGEGAR